MYLVGNSVLRRYDVLSHQFDRRRRDGSWHVPASGRLPVERGVHLPAALERRRLDAFGDGAGYQLQPARLRRLQVGRRSRSNFSRRAKGFELDECHVDKSGNWLMLLEVNPNGSVQNRIVDLRSGTITTIDDVNGSLGHLDMGFGYAVGADNYNRLPNATILLKFPVTSTQRPVGPVVHYNKRWDIAAANHIAHGNAIAGTPAESQYACGSNASRVPDMADEIVCFSLNPNRNPDGSLDVLVVGQVMTDLDAAAAAISTATTTRSCRKAISTSPASISSGRPTWAATASTRSSSKSPSGAYRRFAKRHGGSCPRTAHSGARRNALASRLLALRARAGARSRPPAPGAGQTR